MHTITKEKISKQIEDILGLPNIICEEITANIFKSAENILLKEKVLKIKNFGSFKIIQKKERPGRNIRANTTTVISERKVIRFCPSRNLKDELNQRA